LGTSSWIYCSLDVLRTVSCRSHYGVRLVSKFCGKSAVSFEHLARAEDLLSITCRMSCNLSGFLAVVTDFLQMLANLLTARAGCI
jgi:hypothetical protein